ncbi:hypothetical protein DL95DRAFT_499395 [Leptodontidium sp. 2 PMI_412]|nr:hypothetical protein DL95DRAFT_499395 [Leptodontidium sp. 2 PMI_412]
MEGYPRLGRLMCTQPSYAIFRRFGALNAENLLYLQAEIQELEIALRKQQKEDQESTHRDRIDYARYWVGLKESGEADAEPGNDGRQWELVLRIREKLKEYNAALLQESAVIRLGQPDRTRLKFLVNWMQDIRMGYVHLLGSDSDIWSKGDVLDMIALQAPTADDLFTTWISESAIPAFHRLLGKFCFQPESDEHLGNTVLYKDMSLVRITKLFTTVLACLLPIISIVILYVVDSMSKRLGIVGALTAAFSLCMGLVTSASMADIFAATAAFAAVQVVFVGSTTPQGA